MAQLNALFADPRLTGFQPTPGPFGPIADPFGQQDAHGALFDALIEELLVQQQPGFRPAPELDTFQLLNAEFARRFPRDPARIQVEIRRRQLGEPVPGPNATPEELAEFEREIAARRNADANREARQPLIDQALAARFADLGRITDEEGLRLERFLDNATDEQLAEFAGIGQERRQQQERLEQNLAVPLPVQSAGRLGRRAAGFGSFGASEAMITHGPTGADPLPNLLGDDPLGGDILGEAFDQNAVGGALETAVGLAGGVGGFLVTGAGKLGAGVAARLGVKNLVAKRAVEGFAALGAMEAGSQLVKAPLAVQGGKSITEAMVDAIKEVGLVALGGGALGGAIAPFEAGIKAIIGVLKPKTGVRTPLRRAAEQVPNTGFSAVRPVPRPEPPTTVTRLGSQLPAPGPRQPLETPVAAVEQRLLPAPAEPQIAVVTEPPVAGAGLPGPRPVAPAPVPAVPPVPRETPVETPVPQGEIPRAPTHPIRAPQEPAAQAPAPEAIRPGRQPTQPQTRERGLSIEQPAAAREVGPLPQRVIRIEEAGVKTQLPSQKPQGLFTQPGDQPGALTTGKINEEIFTGKTTVFEVNPEIKVLRVDATELGSTNRGLVGQSPNIVAARQFFGDETVNGFMQTRVPELRKELSRRYPGTNFKGIDQTELIEQAAGVEARRRGFDAIFGVDKSEKGFDEFVALTDKALRPVSPPTRQPGKPFAGAKPRAAQPTQKTPSAAEAPQKVTGPGPPGQSEAAAKELPETVKEATQEGQQFIKLAGKFLGEINAGIPIDKVMAVIRAQAGQPNRRWGNFIPGYSIYAQQLADRVGSQAGTTGQLLARMARRFADRAREFEGRVAPTRLAIEKRFRAKIKERNRMVQLTRNPLSNDSFHAKTQQIIEQNTQADGVDQVFWEQGYRRLLVITGKMAEEVGSRVLLKGGGTRPFKRAMNADRFIRIGSPRFRLAMVSHDPLFNKVVDELMLVNGLPAKDRDLVIETLDQWNGPRAERVVGSIERSREFKVFPTHVRHQGKIVEVLESDPVRSLSGPAGFIPDRAAFIEIFGNNIGPRSKVATLRRQFSDKGGNVFDFDNLVAVMHDRPISIASSVAKQPIQPVRMGTTEGSNLFWRLTVGMLNPMWRGMALSASAIPNITEVISKVPAHAGATRLLRGLARMAANPIKNKRDLLAQGQITSDTVDFMINEQRRLEDVGRLSIELSTRAFGSKYVNEFNEIASATAGRIMVEDIKRKGAARLGGGLGAFDRQRLHLLNYTPAEIQNIAQGKASERLLNSIPGRIAALTQGTTKKGVERSLAANSPTFRFIFDFQSYLQTTLERSVTLLGNLPKAHARGGFKESIPAALLAAEFFLGHGVAGAGSLYLTGIILGRAVDLGESWIDWLTAGMLEAGITGPLRTFEYVNPRDDLGDIAAKITPKGRMFSDLFDLWKERNNFANLTGPEKALELIRRQTPGARAAGPVLTRSQSAYIVAIGLRDPALQKARSRFFDWANDNMPSMASRKPGFNRFRREMKAVVTWIRANDPDRANAAMRSAMRAAIEEETGSIPEGLDNGTLNDVADDAWNRFKSSLRAQKLLDRVPDRLLPDLRKTIGETSIQLLMIEDLILDAFIDGQFTRSIRETARKRQEKKAG